MSEAVKLLDLQRVAESNYGSYDIDLDDGRPPVRLLNPLRLSDNARAELRLMEGQEQDVKDLLRTLELVAATESDARRLIDKLDGDLALVATILEAYGERVQLGEASPSQD